MRSARSTRLPFSIGMMGLGEPHREETSFMYLTPFLWRLLVVAPCSVLAILFIVNSERNLQNTSCDPLDDGLGIAQWMYYMGFCLCVLVLGICFCPPWELALNEAEQESVEASMPTPLGSSTNTSRSGRICFIKGLWAVVVVALAGWWMYGLVVIFYDHPDESGCPTEVHAFGYYLSISVLSIAGLVCLAAGTRAICHACEEKPTHGGFEAL